MQSTQTDQARELLEARLADIDSERTGIETALAALSTNGNGARVTRRGRPKGSTTKRRRGSRKGGTRADQAVELVRQTPDIKAADIAKAMKIKPNYLYRVLDGLVKENRLKKTGLKYRLGMKESGKRAPAKPKAKASAKA